MSNTQNLDIKLPVNLCLEFHSGLVSDQELTDIEKLFTFVFGIQKGFNGIYP